ncbi:MAG: hypothetical protein ABL974_02000 [Prosthecobacter sp.]
MHHYRRRNQSGAALLAVLWVIALLIGLVAGASLLLTQDLDSAAAKRQIFRARMVAEGALNIALNPQVNLGDPLLKRVLSEDEAYEVQIIGEGGRLDPNKLLGVSPPSPVPGAPPLPPPGTNGEDVLVRVFMQWGMKLDQAKKLIAAMKDWVDDGPGTNPNGAESKEYGNNGMPFDRPFRSLEEMALVRGMQEVEMAYPEWRTWFSIYAGATFDLKAAKPEVVVAVTGCQMRQAQALHARFLGRDGVLGTEDDPTLTVNEALGMLGITGPAASTGFYEVTSQTKRYVVRVRIGDLERELSAVAQGPPPTPGGGGGPTNILWMGEANPIKETSEAPVLGGRITR